MDCEHDFRKRFEEWETREELEYLRSLVYECDSCMREYAKMVANHALFVKENFWDPIGKSYSFNELIDHAEDGLLGAGVHEKLKGYIYRCFLKGIDSI